MRYFLTRHKKILVFGLLLAIIFSAITALSTDRGGTEIRLTEFITRERVEEQPVSTFNPNAQPTTPVPAPTPAPAEDAPPPTYPDILIRFIIASGWTPSSKNGYVGQKVIWRNDTDADIQLMELFPKTSSIANGVTIPPDGTAETILPTEGLFTYRELNSQINGRIFVIDPQ